MGNVQTITEVRIPENENRKVFVRYKSHRTIPGGFFGTYVEYLFSISYYRWVFDLETRFNDLMRLEGKLIKKFPTEMANIERLQKFNKMFNVHDSRLIEHRAQVMTRFLQQVLDIEDILSCPLIYKFMNLCVADFQPEYGRKAKEGYLKKSSGGYIEKFSNKIGDYIRVWKWRWIVLHETCIVWYSSPNSDEIQGCLQIDQEFGVAQAGRVITLKTGTRRITFFASNVKDAREWVADLQRMYSPRLQKNVFDSFCPPRMKNEVRVYCNGCEYFQAVALALMSAQREILITSWKNSPTVLLTRPPLPPLRLDQILKYKADQGVAIFVLLYKEVEHIGQGNDSFNVMKKLEGLSENIHCIRHPNKFMGGSTAVLWSHHEKLVVVDRNMAFVGGIDLSFQRWDDEKHLLADEDGLIFPGNDYRQPAPGVFKPVRNLDVVETDPNDSDEEMIEVLVARPGEALPQATTALVDEDDQPFEVEVVVDFGMSANPPPPAAAPETPFPVQRSQSTMHTHGPLLRGGSHRHLDVDDADDEASSAGNNSPQNNDNQEETPEEAEALRREAERKPEESTRGSMAPSMYDSFQQGLSTTKSSISFLGSTVLSYASQAKAAVESYKAQYITSQKLKKSNYWETRDLYPRMGWHDVHCGISGRAARDVATHFVQRWNHHRLSTSSHSKPILRDITDDLNYAICAKCQMTGIYETAQNCPNCGYDLGPVSSFSAPASPAFYPPPVERYSYMIFECRYSTEFKIPFRVHGDCPAVVTSIISNLSPKTARKEDSEGTILDLNGPMSEWLSAFGLFPAVGDVIASINGKCVSHMNSNQIKRLIKRIRKGNSTTFSNNEGFYTIAFRRHYMENLHPLDKPATPNADQGAELIDKDSPAGPVNESPDAESAPEPMVAVAAEEVEVETGFSAAAPMTNDNAPLPRKSAYGLVEDSTPVVEAEVNAELVPESSPSKQNKSAAEVASSEAKDYHPICQAAAHMEISFNMSKLYHEFAKFCDCVPRLCNEQGTCKVQVLRSVGKWSIGTKAEPSILNCYIETIQNSLRFIYIENQFFIGNLAGDGTQNKIAEALLERILRAHSQRQPFRVVVIIPLHPNGDFANAMKSQVVMHYEYMTINRSPNSLLQQLKKRAPGINVQDYINFYSLRNWGVINDKVVSDQIYVHDKLMIVDDRVMIIGSANINDRSMMGFRDSEVAVRIEDTLHVESMLCGQPHTVGFLPHSVRVKLMRQHLGNPPDLDLTDPLNPQTYEVWRSCAANNSASYDELDGPLSYYRCTGSLMYKNALDNFPNRSYLDPDTRHCLDQIKGFLVDWPYNFFSGEDLSPSLATRAIIPNEMWL